MRKAVGIIRVSSVKGREGDSFASPDEQRERIATACERDGLELTEVWEEMDVSGGTALENRAGLRSAIEAIENGSAEVLLAAYFDRLVRSLRVQDELVSRVEKAGGQVMAVDVGRVTNGSAGQWLSGTMLGAVSEYHRRTTAERTGEAQRRAVERGVSPFPLIPPGYRRGPDGRLLVHKREAKTVAEAFAMRARGESIPAIRVYLRRHGVKRSQHGVISLLASRIVLGELHFGELSNLAAHEPIVTGELWRRAQAVRVPRGRKPKSDRLLARLGVLRCATCNARMSVGSAGPTYPVYRCPPTSGDCEHRVTISAELVESAVVERVQSILAGVEGRASAKASREGAETALEGAQGALDAAIRTLADFTDEPAARERLENLRRDRDAAQERLERLGSASVDLTVSADDWDRLKPEGRRALIKATIASVTVAPGRGPERITISAA
jgi:site-specific DNA recombinase